MTFFDLVFKAAFTSLKEELLLKEPFREEYYENYLLRHCKRSSNFKVTVVNKAKLMVKNECFRFRGAEEPC